MNITEEDLKHLKLVRNYFGEHDKTLFEHRAYSILDSLLHKLEQLRKNDVMQAEGSDGADEAAVGQRSVGKTVSAWPKACQANSASRCDYPNCGCPEMRTGA